MVENKQQRNFIHSPALTERWQIDIDVEDVLAQAMCLYASFSDK